MACPPVNFARDIVEAAPARNRALVELRRDGSRREWSFGEMRPRSGTSPPASRAARACAAATWS